jgi:hypothetical protein
MFTCCFSGREIYNAAALSWEQSHDSENNPHCRQIRKGRSTNIDGELKAHLGDSKSIDYIP